MAGGRLALSNDPEILAIHKKQKIRMLEEDFKVVLSSKDIYDLNKCKSLSALDCVANRIIFKRLGGEH